MQQHLSVVGIDLAKRVFHVVGMDEMGKVVLRKRVTQEALIPECMPMNSWIAKGAGAPGSCAGRSSVPSPDHRPRASTSAAGL